MGGRPGPAGKDPHEACPHAFGRDDDHGADQTASLPRALYLLPNRRRPATVLSSDEPGGARRGGVEHAFDPYTQVSSRLKALHEVGHPTDKIELLILGGSWSAYPSKYREWFIRRCFEALNLENPEDDQGEVSLASVQERNSRGKHRNVGLVVETRPDLITKEHLIELRRQGVTKLQLGVQSMDDHILELNHRGHDSQATEEAVSLVRSAGYKVVVHWMPNLLGGATLDSDRQDLPGFGVKAA